MNADASLVESEVDVGQPPEQDSPERALWENYRSTHAINARNALIDYYLPRTRRYAALLYSRRIDNTVAFEDYFQYALCGLIEAMERFDGTRGVSFWTYASYRIQGTVLNGLRIATEHHQMVATLNQGVAHKLDPEKLGLSSKDKIFAEFVEAAIAYAYDYILRNSTSPQVVGIDGFYGSMAIKETIEEVAVYVDKLPEREKLVVKLHYYGDKSFDQISDALGISKGRVSQIHQRALERIREFYRLHRRPLDIQL